MIVSGAFNKKGSPDKEAQDRNNLGIMKAVQKKKKTIKYFTRRKFILRGL